MARVSGSTTAALFDLRSVIALLFGVYGLVLTVTGAVATSEDDLAKAGGININLWTGIGMLLVSAAFVLWVWLRPPAVAPPHTDAAEVEARHRQH
jgi:hypothetical protein